MNKIVFVQKEAEDRLGAMIISGYIKSHGLASEIVINPYKNIDLIKELNPDFVGITVFSSSVDWAISTCRFIKKHVPNVITILGGTHPTFFPKVVEQEGVDAVCIGEGEKPMLEMMKSFDSTLASIENTSNLWVKNSGKITKNALLPLLTKEELSALPFCDRSHYFRHKEIRDTSLRRAWTSRGCPYQCSYCFNSNYKSLYKGLGPMVRQRSVDSLIEELKALKKIGAKVIDIMDDQFLLSGEWLSEFTEKYKKDIGLPFVCNSTANRINRESAALLKKAGCQSANFAIESGVEEIRKKVYEKQISNDHIYNAADALNAYNIPFLTYNMIGIPNESLEDIYQTVKINQDIKTTYPWCSILQPYPGTKLASDILKDEGDLRGKFTYSYFQSSVIGDHKRRKLVSNAQKLFTFAVENNVKYDKFVKLIQSQSPVTSLYPIVFYYYYGKGIRNRYGHSWSSLVKYWFYSR